MAVLHLHDKKRKERHGPQKDQRNNGYRGPEEQWAQRTRGTAAAEDQRNSRHREPVEQLVQGTIGTVGTKDQWKNGLRGPEDQRNRG